MFIKLTVTTIMVKMKILIIDKSLTMRRILCTQLVALGVDEVIEADDGQSGLKKLDENPGIDIIMLDTDLPDMSGISCIKKIRTHQKYSKVKVVIVSSASSRETVTEAFNAGANNYILRPFTSESLKSKLSL